MWIGSSPVSYTHLRAHETRSNLVCRLLLENRHESLVANQIVSPVLQLAFALKTQAIKYLWLNVMPLEDL